jgi:hypothetical protein
VSLDSAFSWLIVRYNPREVLFYAGNARGLEGMRGVLFVPTDSVATVFVAVSSAPGMLSCRQAVTVNAGVDVPRGTSAPGDPLPELFDLAGRRVRPPLRSGVYLERRGPHRTRVVVVR